METKVVEGASRIARKISIWLDAAGAAGFVLFLLCFQTPRLSGGGSSNSERRCPAGVVSCEEHYGDEWLEHDQQRFP